MPRPYKFPSRPPQPNKASPRPQTAMTINPKSPKQTELAIHFVVVGGGMSGLACAIALRRVGHRVTVLEQNTELNTSYGGVRMAPNLSKILYHWGLKDDIKSIGTKSMAIDLLLFETGELLGKHIWDDEMLRETRGEFVFMHHADLRKLLYDNAVSSGAKVRLGCRVVDVDPENAVVMLESGEKIQAHVIVCSDGLGGISRAVMDVPPLVPTGLVMYSTTVPKALMLNDPDLMSFWDQDLVTMYSWFGNGKAVLAFPTGGNPEDMAMYVYGPATGLENDWYHPSHVKGLQDILQSCEPRLRKLSKLVKRVQCIPVMADAQVEDWVHEDGKLVLIGSAAHPIPPGSIQDCSLTIEDGAVLAKLFSHLRSEDQIGSFLWAFEELRQPRCSSVISGECGVVQFMTMPPGDFQEGRDAGMRAKRDAGLSPLSATSDAEETPEWVEIKEVFGYDAEDEADNWWVEWGRLRELAKGVNLGEMVNVAMSTMDAV
ncbi:hypothetical protein ONZ45_g5690 [Pleurotus djamor]|nr:hypothetical protein ONZ45_g5690 [Pleurotus djamor]